MLLGAAASPAQVEGSLKSSSERSRAGRQSTRQAENSLRERSEDHSHSWKGCSGKGRALKREEPKVGNEVIQKSNDLLALSSRDIPVPRDVGFTSAVFGRLQLQVRHGPPLSVCPVSAPLGLAPSWCRGATPGVQKAQHTGDHQQTRLCWGWLLPDSSPSAIRSSQWLQTERAIAAQH